MPESEDPQREPIFVAGEPVAERGWWLRLAVLLILGVGGTLVYRAIFHWLSG